MAGEEEDRGRKKDSPSRSSIDTPENKEPEKNEAAVTGILDDRIQNLGEAIDEIDAALAGRRKLNSRFIVQIEAEADEVKRHLNMLQPPWKTGFYPEVEFLRLSFHKSLTSRAKEKRTEELKYWENGVNLAKERRKFLDEYKALLAARGRMGGT